MKTHIKKREADRIIAEKFMKLNVRDGEIFERTDGLYEKIPHYTKYISDAWELVEKVSETETIFVWKSEENWHCLVGDILEGYVSDKEAPLAICKAILQELEMSELIIEG